MVDDNSSDSSELEKFLEQEKLKPKLPLGHKSNLQRRTQKLDKNVFGGFSESKGNLNLLKSGIKNNFPQMSIIKQPINSKRNSKTLG